MVAGTYLPVTTGIPHFISPVKRFPFLTSWESLISKQYKATKSSGCFYWYVGIGNVSAEIKSICTLVPPSVGDKFNRCVKTTAIRKKTFGGNGFCQHASHTLLSFHVRFTIGARLPYWSTFWPGITDSCVKCGARTQLTSPSLYTE